MLFLFDSRRLFAAWTDESNMSSHFYAVGEIGEMAAIFASVIKKSQDSNLQTLKNSPSFWPVFFCLKYLIYLFLIFQTSFGSKCEE